VRGKLEAEVRGIWRARAKRLPLRNVLVLGSSGNGKSLAVQRLAEASGLEHATINGSDFGPWGGAAAAEVHKLFAWAKTSRRGE
jgi:AAA+ superfamily predicted ATPase